MRIGKLGDKSWRRITTIRGGRITTIPGIEISGPVDLLLADGDFMLIDEGLSSERIVLKVGPGTGKSQNISRYFTAHLTTVEAAKIKSSRKTLPRSFSFLRGYLPKELKDHSEEVQQFLEDGIADRLESNRPTTGYILYEFINLVFFIVMANISKFRKMRRRRVE